MKGKRKNILFVFLLLVLLMPVLNMKLKLIESGGLDGTGTAGNVYFSWKGWWDGSYQHNKDLYLNDNIGFRPDFVRINNQLDFSLFNKINAGGVVMDKDEYLYYSDYIEEYTGRSYEGENQPRQTLMKLKKVQDTLEKLGKTVLLVYAPSKPYYYPEHLSTIVNLREGDETNFKTYFRIGDSLGIHQVDFNRWYVSLKNKTPYPLFSKQGIHYTRYGSLFAVDSIIKYIEYRRGIKMPHPVYEKVDTTTQALKPDDDVGRVLNLMFPIQEQFYYPRVIYKPDSNVSKPQTIYIGDSFVWPMLYSGIMNTNTRPEFWYYCKRVYSTNFEQGFISDNMEKYDWLKSVKEADCIIMVYTATQLVKMQEGFLNNAYEHFFPAKQ